MIFADTGWLIALIDERDALHDRAMLWLRALTEPVITTEYVLLETYNSMSGPMRRQRCHAMIDRLLSSFSMTVASDASRLFEAGVRLHRERIDKTWSLTDCISFTLMTQLQMRQTLAHDHHFVQAGFDALLRRDPA